MGMAWTVPSNRCNASRDVRLVWSTFALASLASHHTLFSSLIVSPRSRAAAVCTLQLLRGCAFELLDQRVMGLLDVQC